MDEARQFCCLDFFDFFFFFFCFFLGFLDVDARSKALFFIGSESSESGKLASSSSNPPPPPDLRKNWSWKSSTMSYCYHPMEWEDAPQWEWGGGQES
jgi:hypothetical protein